jgi:hypothetical protein
MTVRRAPRIADIAAEWRDSLPHRSILTTPEWLTVDDEGRRDEARYVLDGGAGLVVQRVAAGSFPTNDPIALLLTSEPADGGDPAAHAEIAARRSRLAERLSRCYPVAAATLPGAYLPGVVGSPALLDELEAAARDWGCAVVAVPHVPDGDPLAGLLTARGYVGFAGLAQASLDVAWPDFDAYVATLPKRRRNKVRRERREFAAAGMVVREDSVGSRGPELAELHADQLRRYGHDIGVEFLNGLIARIERYLAPWCRLLVAERGGALEAFALCYAYGRELHVKMAGFSADAQKHFGYFAMTYYEVIEYAIRRGLRTVVFGPLTYRAKVVRGCRLDPRSTYLRVPPGLAAEVAELAGLVDHHNRAAFDGLGKSDT